MLMVFTLVFSFVLPDTFYADATSIVVVDFSSPVVTDIEGNVLIQAAKDQQIVLSTTVFNNLLDHSQPYVAIMEVRDETGITEHIAWSSGILQANANQTIGVSFVPPAEGRYTVRVFAISDLEQPQILSAVRESEIRVGSEKLLQKVYVFDSYPLPTAKTLTDYMKTEAAKIQSKVCGEDVFDISSLDDTDPNLVRWLPQELTFSYLEPKDTVFRQGCSINEYAIQYKHFIMQNQYENSAIRKNLPVPVSDTNQLFRSITSEQQALEYVAYFSISQNEKGIRFIIPSEQQFESATTGCQIEKNPSSRDITVTEKAEDYVVEINIFDRSTGGIYHQDWLVPKDQAYNAYPISAFKIGQCSIVN